jgi:hypothetical protein
LSQPLKPRRFHIRQSRKGGHEKMSDSYVWETLAKLIGVVTLSGLIWGIS